METYLIPITFRRKTKQPIGINIVTTRDVYFLSVHEETASPVIRTFIGSNLPDTVTQPFPVTHLIPDLKREVHII